MKLIIALYFTVIYSIVWAITELVTNHVENSGLWLFSTCLASGFIIFMASVVVYERGDNPVEAMAISGLALTLASIIMLLFAVLFFIFPMLDINNISGRISYFYYHVRYAIYTIWIIVIGYMYLQSFFSAAKGLKNGIYAHIRGASGNGDSSG